MKRSGSLVVALVAVHSLVGCGTRLRPDLRSHRPVAANAGSGGGLAAPLVAAALDLTPEQNIASPCPPAMVDIEGRFCVDKYEASLVEVLPSGEERPHSPYATVDSGSHLRAVSVAGVYPQGYISANQAAAACSESGKRLCRPDEWQMACRGPENRSFGYGDRREPGKCNDRGRNPVMHLYGPRYDASTMNQPQLNQLSGTLSKTAEHADCTNGYGVYDMVGNLHEWVADPRGTFYGGYYQDVKSLGHGEGCSYLTTAHEARYHDYSTGFRCCSDLRGSAPAKAARPAPPPPMRSRKRR